MRWLHFGSVTDSDSHGPIPSPLWWIFYSGLEHMTILGHQRGPSYMLLPLRPHCAASDLMSQQRLWRFLLFFHNSQLSVSCGLKPPTVALNRKLADLHNSSCGFGIQQKLFCAYSGGWQPDFRAQKVSRSLDFRFPWGNRWGWRLHCSEIQYEWASILCWVTQLTGSVS